MHFDPTIIEEFARRLLAQARGTVAILTVAGALIGAAFGWQAELGAPSWIIGAAVGGLIGFALGRQRAFRLRLDAQTALCQVAIERNTRAAARGERAAGPRQSVAA